MDLGLTWFDFAAAAVVLLSAVMSFARGFIRELFSVIAFVAGIIAALFLFFSGITRPIVENFTPLNGMLADLAGGLAVFLIVFIIITVITASLAKTAHESTEVGSFDRAAGLAFGLLRGVLFVSALFVLPVHLMGADQGEAGFYRNAVVNARTYPIYSSVASAILMLAPKGQQRVRDIIERQRGESAPIPPAAPATEPAPAPN